MSVKTIHYCWFGSDPLPPIALKCIASWKKYCPEYEIKEWNEKNFDVNICDYTREAYACKKWAFVSDYARFWILYNYGGVYFDTDVELIASIDDLIEQGPFMGLEQETNFKLYIQKSKFAVASGLDLLVNPGLGLSVNPGFGLYKKILEYYNKEHFYKANGAYNMATVVDRVSYLLSHYPIKYIDKDKAEIAGIYIYNKEFFCPIDYITGKLMITDKTVSIHHFEGSWLSEEEQNALKIQRKLCKFLSRRIAGYIAKGIAICNARGVKNAYEETIDWLKRKYLRKSL